MNDTTSPNNPIAEAVKGYMRDRSTLLEATINALRNDKLSKEQIAETEKIGSRLISSIDQKVKEMIAMDTSRDQMRFGGSSLNI